MTWPDRKEQENPILLQREKKVSDKKETTSSLKKRHWAEGRNELVGASQSSKNAAAAQRGLPKAQNPPGQGKKRGGSLSPKVSGGQPFRGKRGRRAISSNC